MRCAIERCGTDTRGDDMVLCDGHATEYSESGEVQRLERMSQDEKQSTEEWWARRGICLRDFIARRNAEARNSRSTHPQQGDTTK